MVVIDLTALENMIGKIGTCYMCGKDKIIAIQHNKQITEYAEGPLRLICEEYRAQR
jgi:heterodisulfide reductase subunit B